MTAPNKMFELIRADEVAETWEGVSEELYQVLWNDIVPHQKEIPNLEDSGPHDHIGHENLASHWNRLIPAHQDMLNELAEKRDQEFKEWLGR